MVSGSIASFWISSPERGVSRIRDGCGASILSIASFRIRFERSGEDFIFRLVLIFREAGVGRLGTINEGSCPTSRTGLRELPRVGVIANFILTRHGKMVILVGNSRSKWSLYRNEKP